MATNWARIGIFEWLQKYAVDDRKDRRVGSQSHSKAKYRYRGESGRLAEHAKAEVQILHEI